MVARKPVRKLRNGSPVKLMLQNIVQGKALQHFTKGQSIFRQGDAADTLYFVDSGRVKLTVVSSVGKEAVLAVLGLGEFFGEGCLVGQHLRLNTATAMDPSEVFCVQKSAMARALAREQQLAESFIALLVSRNIDMEADLCDQPFNHSEKRLARVLLKLARFGENKSGPHLKIDRISHETLAEMVGTTRPRITHFMNKFRRMGLIDYNGETTVHSHLLVDLLLHE